MFYYRYRNLTCLFSLSMNAVFVPSLAQFFLHTINLWFRVKKKPICILGFFYISLLHSNFSSWSCHVYMYVCFKYFCFVLKDSRTFRKEGFGGHYLGNSDDMLLGGERSRPVSQEPPGKDPPQYHRGLQNRGGGAGVCHWKVRALHFTMSNYCKFL